MKRNRVIRAIIFDCFGVLATEGWVSFRNKAFGDDPARLNEANELMRAMSVGVLTPSEFMQQISEMSGTSVADLRPVFYRNVPNDELFGWIRKRVEVYKFGILSNITTGRIAEIFSTEQLELFSDLALSCDTGFAKPDPNAYFTAADRLGVLPDECLFVDDQERNVTVARELGMQGIVYGTFSQFEAEAQKLLG